MSNSHLDDELECIIEQLRTENAELKQELITRVGELQTMSEEKAALKAMVNELRGIIVVAMGSRWEIPTGVLFPVNSTKARSALNKIPAQSLHDHDMVLAEKVRDACFTTTQRRLRGIDCHCSGYNKGAAECGDAIRNLDLIAIVRGEGEKE